MAAGDDAAREGTDVRGARPPVPPWPTAAQRAAARAAAEAARLAAEEAEFGPVGQPTVRPRIEDDTVLLGLTRRSNSRLGQRLFTLFFVFVFLVILLQLLVTLLGG